MRKEIIGDATLYLGDCLEILPTLDKVDAVVTDPPYGMRLNADFSGMTSKFKGSTGGNKYDDVEGDHVDFDPAPIMACIDGAASQVWFGADYYAERIPRRMFGSWDVWDKRLTESADKMFGSCFELMWATPKRKREIFRVKWAGIFRVKWAGIFGMERQDTKTRQHPTQKPIELMERVLLKHTGQVATVLDPFMGSGTTGVACANLGRKFIGIEIEEKYFDIACERIEAAQAQGRLFA